MNPLMEIRACRLRQSINMCSSARRTVSSHPFLKPKALQLFHHLDVKSLVAPKNILKPCECLKTTPLKEREVVRGNTSNSNWHKRHVTYKMSPTIVKSLICL